MIQLEKDLLYHFRFGTTDISYGNYLDICNKYQTPELKHEHEQQVLKDYVPVFFLKMFPNYTSPFGICVNL